MLQSYHFSSDQLHLLDSRSEWIEFNAQNDKFWRWCWHLTNTDKTKQHKKIHNSNSINLTQSKQLNIRNYSNSVKSLSQEARRLILKIPSTTWAMFRIGTIISITMLRVQGGHTTMATSSWKHTISVVVHDKYWCFSGHFCQLQIRMKSWQYEWIAIKSPFAHWLWELNENGRVGQNILQVVPSAAPDTRHHETAQSAYRKLSIQAPQIHKSFCDKTMLVIWQNIHGAFKNMHYKQLLYNGVQNQQVFRHCIPHLIC